MGDPTFSFFDSRMRSSAAAKAHVQGAHPWGVRSRFFDRYATVQRKVPNGDLELQGRVPPFLLHRKDELVT